MIDLTQPGEIFARIDLFLNLGNDHIADDLGGDLTEFLDIDLFQLICPEFLFAQVVAHGHVVFFQHDLEVAFEDIRHVFVFVDHGFVRDDPHLDERVYGDIGGAVELLRAGVDLVPEFLSEVFFGVHQRGGQLFEDIVLGEHVPAHLGHAEFSGDDAVAFIG